MRILVIEDTIIAQIAEATMLENLGCKVDVANTGKEAIEKTNQAQEYDVIFLDLGLPDVDALTVTENILTNYANKTKSAPPIIALTAHAYDSLRKECLKAGMSDFLAKPLTEDIARALLVKYQDKSKPITHV
jgi:CheY-like chemotaxis protein